MDTGSIPLSKSGEDLSVEVGERVSTDNGTKTYQQTIRDNARQRAWSGEGPTASEAATRAMRNFMSDRRAPEYVKSRG
jgi:hypothetical protein